MFTNKCKIKSILSSIFIHSLTSPLNKITLKIKQSSDSYKSNIVIAHEQNQKLYKLKFFALLTQKIH